MSLIRWSPMLDSFSEMDQIFNNLPMTTGGSSVKTFIPAMDMYETDAAVIVETSLAGVDPKDVEVTCRNGVLMLKGETKKEHEIEEKNYYRKEVRSGSFYREISLPSQVDENKVNAEFENGMLKVICPKVSIGEAKKVNVKVVKK